MSEQLLSAISNLPPALSAVAYIIVVIKLFYDAFIGLRENGNQYDTNFKLFLLLNLFCRFNIWCEREINLLSLIKNTEVNSNSKNDTLIIRNSPKNEKCKELNDKNDDILTQISFVRIIILF